MLQKKHSKIITIGIIILLSLIAFSHQSLADDIGVSSSPIIINDALKGVSYFHTITIHNKNTDDVNITLNKYGIIEEWISFCDYENISITYTEIVIPNDETKKVIIKIDVPENTSNQLYNSEIIIKEKKDPKEGNESATVIWQYPLKVSINVTGEQNLNVTIDTFFVNKNEVGYPVITNIKIINSGNVIAEPKIFVNITKSSIPVIALSDLTQQIHPGSFYDYHLLWNTSGMVPGEYQAHVQIYLGGNIIREETITFDLFKVGALLREGIIDNVAVAGNAQKGETIRLTAQFLNTGEIEVQAQLICNIDVDNKLESTIKSFNGTIPKGQLKTFHVNYIIPKNGSYTFESYYIYDDVFGYKETNMSKIMFTVGSTDPSNLPLFILIGIPLIFIIGAIIIYFKKDYLINILNKNN